MSKRWIQVSEKILDQMKRLKEVKKRDRLELVRSIHFVLSALNRSLWGWMQWVNNPDVMTQFTQEDLEEVNKKLSGFTRSFMEYDLEATKLGVRRGLKAIKKAEKKKEGKPEVSYVA